ncbi:MAG: serine/threonine protein kinase [Candidatus Eutrophobiaceae bacterium]
MLRETVVGNISSLGREQLESLYACYCKELHGKHKGMDGFIAWLFKSGEISVDEYQSIQRAESEQAHSSDLRGLETAVSQTEFSDSSCKSDGKGERIGNYSILEIIDQGAMGKIKVAYDNKLARRVAYKELHVRSRNSARYRRRFRMEAQITAQLEHPSIIPVYALLKGDNTLGYTMKLVQGGTLFDMLFEAQQQRVKGNLEYSVDAMLLHFLKVCDALFYAHQKGVVHRDIKPKNIMIGECGDVYVMDWGIAMLYKPSKLGQDIVLDTGIGMMQPQQKTDIDDGDAPQQANASSGKVIGTFAYISPEQAGGLQASIDQRSDLYALGLILHEVITLHRAIGGFNKAQILAKAKEGVIDPVPLGIKVREKHKPLLAIVKKATQFQPDQRYEDVGQMADDIRRYFSGEAISAMPESLYQSMKRWIGNHAKATLGILVYTILIALGAVGYIFHD